MDQQQVRYNNFVDIIKLCYVRYLLLLVMQQKDYKYKCVSAVFMGISFLAFRTQYVASAPAPPLPLWNPRFIF